MLNCTAGIIDDSNFSKPMPVIGVYVAAASLLCAIAMVIDAVKGFNSKQYWIPSNYFSLNAASLTVVGVAIKLSVDLNSPMPSKIDQLSKLSTSAFICTVLANFQPSLGKLENGELLANIMALFILVITSIVNLYIQLNTGAILSYKAAHIVMIVSISYDLLICLHGAAQLRAWKNYFQRRFEQTRRDKRIGDPTLFYVSYKNPQKLREYLTIISMMAQSSCPHFVMVRTALINSLWFVGLLSASTFVVILFATMIHKDRFISPNTCSGVSDYGRSSLGILIAQTIAVVVGVVVSICRYRCHLEISRARPPRNKEPHEEDKEVDFWMQHLDETKEHPILYSPGPWYSIKYLLHLFISGVQSFSVENSTRNLITVRSFIKRNCLGEGKKKENHGPVDFNPEPMDLSAYFLHLEREKRAIKLMEKLCSHVTQRCIDIGKRGNPQNLKEFLKEHLSRDFDGVASFYNDEIPPLVSSGKSPPNCWALAVLTLTSVATALPNIDPTYKERLMMSANEGLKYVKLMEDHMNGHDDFINIRAAATIVCFGLHPGRIWLGINLKKLALKSANPAEALLRLANFAKESFFKFTGDDRGDQRRNTLGMKWSSEPEKRRTWKAVAAHSMYIICETMLQQNCQNESSDVIFKRLSITIADIFGACFTNLTPCIVSICEKSSIEKRRETVFQMLIVFGETEEIMEILAEEERNIPDVPSDEMGFIDKWHSYLKHLNVA